MDLILSWLFGKPDTSGWVKIEFEIWPSSHRGRLNVIWREGFLRQKLRNIVRWRRWSLPHWEGRSAARYTDVKFHQSTDKRHIRPLLPFTPRFWRQNSPHPFEIPRSIPEHQHRLQSQNKTRFQPPGQIQRLQADPGIFENKENSGGGDGWWKLKKRDLGHDDASLLFAH